MASYNAIVVDGVNGSALLHGPGLRSTKQPDFLLIEHVVPPYIDATFSHGDGMELPEVTKQQGSRNVAGAVRYAKTVGIRYLFVDQTSIDQTLPADEILGQVTLFPTLYKAMPVIAAYSLPGASLVDIIYSPWICSEGRLFQHNPKIVSVDCIDIQSQS